MSTADHKFDSAHAAPLRIAMVSETYPPEVNGVAVTVRRMVEGMRERGHTVELVRPRQGTDDAPACEDTFSEVLTGAMPLFAYYGLQIGRPSKNKLLKHWQQNRPDIIQVATEGPLGWSAVSAARKLGIPVATDFHTNFHTYTEHYGVGWLNKPIGTYLRHFHNRTDCTMVPTRELRDILVQDRYKDVAVVSRGVDTALFHPAKRNRELRQQWGADDDTPVVVMVSRMAAEKNLQVVVNAFEQMQAIIGDAKLVMVGDGPERAGLQAKHPNVIFAGMRSGEDLAEHYASGDVFLYPSLTETYGNVTVEAMASGLAVLAYDYAAAREHIRHDVNGLLVPFNDTQAFYEQAVALVQIPDRIERLRQHARKSIEQLTWSAVMGQLEGVLQNIAQLHGDQHVQTVLSPEQI